MSYFNSIYFADSPAIDAGGRIRVSEIKTLFDGKILNADEPLIWENTGTGTATYNNNYVALSVTSGQYIIRTSRHYLPYFSGKSQGVELTFDNFQAQANTTKRIGYFSSNAVAPYDSSKDGWWLENDGTTIRFIVSNNGTEKANVALSSFDNYSAISSYDWSKFTIIVVDWLWLGGSRYRVSLNFNGEFVIAHSFKFAGNFTGTSTLSPNHKVRYEVRSSTGTGSMNCYCSQVMTEGSFDEGGLPLALPSLTGISCNSVGTIYAIKSIKKNATYRDNACLITDISAYSTSGSDFGTIMLLLNPTLSGAITYANKSRIQEGTPTNQTVSSTGRVLASFPVGQSGGTSDSLKNSYLNFLSISLNNTPDEYVLAYMPATATQTVYGNLSVKEF